MKKLFLTRIIIQGIVNNSCFFKILHLKVILSRSFDNDIAVIKFDTDVEFKVGIQPVCLPSKTPGVLGKSFESEEISVLFIYIREK